jgi:hypothetical protein
MKNIFTRLLLVVLCAFALAACNTTPTVIHDTKLILPEDSLLQDCPVEAPPAQATYPTLTPKEKEKALSDFGNKQTKNIALCNGDKAGLRKWKKEQQEKYKSIDAKSKKGE